MSLGTDEAIVQSRKSTCPAFSTSPSPDCCFGYRAELSCEVAWGVFWVVVWRVEVGRERGEEREGGGDGEREEREAGWN